MANTDGSITVRLDKPWSQFTEAEKQAFLDAVAARTFPGGAPDDAD